MATTNIEFTKTGGGYVCQLDSSAAISGVIHLAMSEPNQIVSVMAGTPGMPPMVIQTMQTPHSLGLVFELNFPESIQVTLRTSKPVTEAVWIK